jgi:hypothetical protein
MAPRVRPRTFVAWVWPGARSNTLGRRALPRTCRADDLAYGAGSSPARRAWRKRLAKRPANHRTHDSCSGVSTAPEL